MLYNRFVLLLNIYSIDFMILEMDL